MFFSPTHVVTGWLSAAECTVIWSKINVSATKNELNEAAFQEVRWLGKQPAPSENPGVGVKTKASHLVFHAGTKTVLTFIYTLQTRQNQSPLCSPYYFRSSPCSITTRDFFFFFTSCSSIMKLETLLSLPVWFTSLLLLPFCLPQSLIDFMRHFSFVNYLLLSAIECWKKRLLLTRTQCLNRIQKPRQALHVAWLDGALQTDYCHRVLFIWKRATNEKKPPG